jgi:hypothetical protein
MLRLHCVIAVPTLARTTLPLLLLFREMAQNLHQLHRLRPLQPMHRYLQLLSHPTMSMERVGVIPPPSTVHITHLLLLNHNSKSIHILPRLKPTFRLSLSHTPNSSNKLKRDRNKRFILEHPAGLTVLPILMPGPWHLIHPVELIHLMRLPHLISLCQHRMHL